ncbi:hypothetical protein RM543_04555 [Roseicyclus sp. F158]|uniref:Autotransporter domain-containing protein n=1 Tax=Tropicimonas omnivorans TaxID=3075590 RepID=A0ABU3DE37_9RHOB|nr:hypothetical protein [Roseicyclus sp. F158]MDT0681947.1 hypothetical protein [Roseicyclus sp. F158]
MVCQSSSPARPVVRFDLVLHGNPRTFLSTTALAAALTLLMGAGGAEAQLYWYPGGQGTTEGGDGNWSQAEQNWNGADDGNGTQQGWQNDSPGTFGGTPGTVTVTEGVSVGTLTFEADGYTVTGGAEKITGFSKDPASITFAGTKEAAVTFDSAFDTTGNPNAVSIEDGADANNTVVFTGQNAIGAGVVVQNSGTLDTSGRTEASQIIVEATGSVTASGTGANTEDGNGTGIVSNVTNRGAFVANGPLDVVGNFTTADAGTLDVGSDMDVSGAFNHGSSSTLEVGDEENLTVGDLGVGPGGGPGPGSKSTINVADGGSLSSEGGANGIGYANVRNFSELNVRGNTSFGYYQVFQGGELRVENLGTAAAYSGGVNAGSGVEGAQGVNFDANGGTITVLEGGELVATSNSIGATFVRSNGALDSTGRIVSGITNFGVLTAEGTGTISGDGIIAGIEGNVRNIGSLVLSEDLEIEGNVTNTVVERENDPDFVGSIDLGSSALVISGTLTQSSSETITIDDGESLTAGSVNIASGSSIDVAGALRTDTTPNEFEDGANGTIQLSGSLSVQEDGTVETGSLTFNDGASLTNDGTVTVGTLTNNSDGLTLGGNGTYDIGTFDNQGDLNVTTDVDLGDALSNSDLIEIDAGATLSAGTINNLGAGTIEVEGTLFGTGNTIDNSGTINVYGGGTLQDNGAINNDADGVVTFDNSADAGAGTPGDAMTLSADLNDDDEDEDVVTNSGTLTVEGNGDAATDLTVTSNLVNTADDAGTIEDDRGSVTISEGSVVVFEDAGETLSVTNAGDFTLANDDDSGTTAATELEVETFTNAEGGVLTVEDELDGGGASTFTLDANLVNEAGATANLSGIIGGNTYAGDITNDGTIDDNGDLTVNGTVTNQSGGSFTVDTGTLTAGQFNNTGTDGDPTPTASTFTVETTANLTGLSNTAGGAVSVTDGGTLTVSEAGVTTDTITNDGTGTTFALSGAGSSAQAETIDNTDGATFTIGEGTTVETTSTDADAFDNAATLDLDGGTLTSNLTNSGDADANGTITGDVSNSGTGASFDADGDLTVTGDFTNDDDADFTVSDGTTSISGTLTNDSDGSNGDDYGIVVSSGTTLEAADIVNEEDATILVDNATLLGTDDGTTTNSGTITVTGGGAALDNGAIENTTTGTYVFDGDAGSNPGAAMTFNADADTDNETYTPPYAAGTDEDVIFNEGAIEVVSGTVNSESTLDNQADGTLSVDDGASYIVSNTGSDTDNTISNEGTITVGEDGGAGGSELEAPTISNLDGGTIDVNASTLDTDLTNEGTVTMSGTLTGDLLNTDIDNDSTAGTFTADGTLGISGSVTNQEGADFNIADGTTTVDGTFTNTSGTDVGAAPATLDLVGGDLDVDGLLINEAGSDITVADNTLTAFNITNRGAGTTLTATSGDIIADTSTVENSAGASISITDGGTLQVETDLTNTGTDSSIAIAGDTGDTDDNLTAESVTNADGASLTLSGGADGTIDGGVVNTGADTELTVTGTGTTLEAETLDNLDTATLTVSDDAVLTLTSGDDDALDNEATFDLDGARLVGNLTNTGTVTANGTGAVGGTGNGIEGNVDNEGAGSFTLDGDLDLDGSFENADIATLDTDGNDLTVSGTLTQTSSTAIDVDGGETVTVADLSIGDEAVVNVEGAGSTLITDEDQDGTADGDIDVAANGALTVGAGGTVQTDTATFGGLLSNEGTFDAEGAVTVTGIGTAIAGAASAPGTENGVYNAGDFDADSLDLGGDFYNDTAGDVDIAGLADIDGMLVNLGAFDADTFSLTDDGALDNDGDVNVTGAADTGENTEVDNSGTFDAASLDNDGSFDNEAGGTLTLTGDLDSSGDMTNADTATINADTFSLTDEGTLDNDGDVNVTGAADTGENTEVDNSGTFDAASLDNDGSFDNEAGGTLTLTGDLDNSGDMTNADTATINADTFSLTDEGTLDNDGDVNITGAADTGEDTEVDNSGTFDAASLDNDGSFNNVSGGTLTLTGDLDSSGDIINAATGTINAGTFSLTDDGTLDNNNDFNVTGAADTGEDTEVDNSGTFDAASLLNQGDFDNEGIGTVTVATLTNEGTFDNNGVIVGDLDNQEDATFESAGVINGAVTNAGDFDLDGNSIVSGSFTNEEDGEVFDSGAFALSGITTFENDGAVTFDEDGSSLTATTFDNTGALNLLGGDQTLTATTMANSGTIEIRGDDVIDVDTLDNAGGTISLVDGDTDDSLDVTGEIQGGTLAFDISLGSDPGATDVLTFGSLTESAGNQLQLAFNTLSTGAILSSPLEFALGDTTGVSIDNAADVTGLPPAIGPLSYVVLNDGSSLAVASVIDPGAASVAGNIGLVQSLINTVVNRPSSPFVSGLVYEDEDKCGPGVWTRGQAGYAEGTSDTDNGLGGLPSTVRANYSGLTFGADYGCFDAADGAFDLAGGITAGVNRGQTRQDIFAVDFSGTSPSLTDDVTSTTTSEFDQRYVGGYVAFARGPLTGDVQLRFERTDYEFDNEDIGLYDEETSSEGTTVSASLSYAFPLGEDMVVVPTAGIGITRSETEDLAFRDGDGNKIGEIQFEDHTTKIGFLGATVAKTVISDAGDSAFNYFGTATYYGDFSDDKESAFVIDDTEQEISTEPLGNFGELSVGFSYVRILDGQIGAAKQLNASVRADARFSDDVEGYGLTAQLRLQF